MSEYCEKVEALLAGLPDAYFIDAHRAVAQGKELAGDDAGELDHAIADIALEEMGLPKTGPAASHDLGKQVYEEIRSAVRSTQPVHKQVREIRGMTEAPAEHERQVDEKARGAEEKLGPHMVDSIDRDKSDRQRVEGL